VWSTKQTCKKKERTNGSVSFLKRNGKFTYTKKDRDEMKATNRKRRKTMPSHPSNHSTPHSHESIGSHAACVSLVPIFNHLEESQMQEVAQATKSRSYKKGEYLFQPGDAS